MQDIPLKNVSLVVYNAQGTGMTDFLRLHLQSLGGQPKVEAFLPFLSDTKFCKYDFYFTLLVQNLSVCIQSN